MAGFSLVNYKSKHPKENLNKNKDNSVVTLSEWIV